MRKKQIFYLVFFGVLVIGFFVVLLVVIPGFAKPRFPAIGTVQPFSFTNQDGKAITDKNVEGKVVGVEYFFTTCTGICPRLNNNMRKVYDEFKNENDFIILSHTSPPLFTNAINWVCKKSSSMFCGLFAGSSIL